MNDPIAPFASCQRGFHEGMYEGLSASQALAQVGIGYKESLWPFPHSKPNPREMTMGFRGYSNKPIRRGNSR